MAKPGPKLNKEQRETVKLYAWEKRTQCGWSHWQIKLGLESEKGISVDRTTVTRSLSVSKTNARKQIDDMAVQTIYEQSDQADFIVSQALEQFRGEKDSAWLNTALKGMEHKAKVQGAYSDKLEISDPTGSIARLADAQSKLAHLIAAHVTAQLDGSVAEQSQSSGE